MSTIREVATLAGVSAATVSRVINHDTRYKMTDDTKERVWKAVAELNYKAPSSSNAQMEIVKTASDEPSHRLGVVLNVRGGGKYTDPYYLSILEGFEKAILHKGYEIAFIRSREELADPQILHSTFAEPISGVLLMNSLSPEELEFVMTKTRNIVGVDTGIRNIDNVGYDHYDAARIAVTHLAEQGYKRIGFIGGQCDIMKESRRYQSYYSTLHMLDLPFDPDWVIASNWDDAFCEEVIEKAVDEGKLPDAYFAASDLMAMAALRGLYNRGINVPKDLAMVGLCNIEMSKYASPPLTTVAIKMPELGETAAAVLIDRINGDTSPAKTITVPCSLVKRSST